MLSYYVLFPLRVEHNISVNRCSRIMYFLRSLSKLIASFPGHSHLPSLIPCSMQIQRWRTGRYSHARWCQVVDTWGTVPDCNNSNFALTHPWHCEQWTALMLPCEHWPPALNRKGLGDSLSGTALMRLPSVYLRSLHVTVPPRPSPLYFYAASDQILEVGTAWVWG